MVIEIGENGKVKNEAQVGSRCTCFNLIALLLEEYCPATLAV